MIVIIYQFNNIQINNSLPFKKLLLGVSHTQFVRPTKKEIGKLNKKQKKKKLTCCTKNVPFSLSLPTGSRQKGDTHELIPVSTDPVKRGRNS